MATLEDALEAAKNATGNTVFAIVSPRQAERLHLALYLADRIAFDRGECNCEKIIRGMGECRASDRIARHEPDCVATNDLVNQLARFRELSE